MPAPSRADLQHALLEIRHAADRLKSYESAFVDGLHTTIVAHTEAIEKAQYLPAALSGPCTRIASQCKAVLECIQRARQYPAHIMARADVLDRTGMLAKMIRDLQAELLPPKG